MPEESELADLALLIAAYIRGSIMSLLQSRLNFSQSVVLSGGRKDTSSREVVVSGALLELVCELTEVVEHSKVFLADPRKGGLALGTHGGEASSVLVVFVSEEVGGVTIEVFEVLLVICKESRIVLLHDSFDLLAGVFGDTTDVGAELRVGSIAVVGPETVDGCGVLGTVVVGVLSIGGPELGAENKTALLATLDEGTVEAAVGRRAGRDVVLGLARELGAGLGTGSDLLTLVPEGVAELAELTEDGVGSDGASGSEKDERGGGGEFHRCVM